MPRENQMLLEMGETGALAREKKDIEGKLVSAGGQEFHFLLGMCEDLSDIIEDVSEIYGKKEKKEHAAFETKVKFFRKVRRKAKDLNRFEQEIVQQFDQKHISVAHGRKMAAIVKLLKSNNVEKARQEADEFYQLLEMGARLKEIDETLLKKHAQLDRARLGISTQLSGMEWLEGQPQIEREKVARHELKLGLQEKLQKARMAQIKALQTMPLPMLLEKMQSDNLEPLGFPEIAKQDAERLCEFLRKSNLGQNTSGQLYEMGGMGEKKLQHMGIDLAGFRREIAERKAYFSKIMSLHATDFLSADSDVGLEYLARNSGEARQAKEKLAELGKSAEEDEKEWVRSREIEAKRAELSGVEKSALVATLKELDGFEHVLDGKAANAEGKAADAEQEKKSGKGILKRIAELLS